MGLYINENDHLRIYKTVKKIDEPNQSIAKIDQFSEWLKEQKRINRTLFRSYHYVSDKIEKDEHVKQYILNTLNEFERKSRRA